MTTMDRPPDAKLETQRRRRFSARDRKRLLRLYRHSGQSVADFGRENDVCPSSLWRWLARERRSGQEASSAGELVEIPVVALRAPEAAAPAVSMQISGVVRLEVAVGTDPEWLGALVRALPPARQ
jgi:transposase-like protein